MVDHLRIGFDAKRYFSNSTGLGVYSRLLIDAWREFYPNDEITLFAPKAPRQLEKVQVISPRWPVAKSVWRSLAPIEIAAQTGLQIYHGLSNEIPRMPQRSKIQNCPYVLVTIHDVLFREFRDQYPILDRIVYHLKTSYACHNADHVIAISDATARALESEYGVSRSKITVVPQSVSVAFSKRYSLDEIEIVRAKYSLPESYALCLGSLVLRKNQLRILEAFERLPENDAIPLVFVGSEHSAYAQLVKTLAQQSPRCRSIFFLGAVGHADLPALIQGALFSIYMSLGEGFGLPVAESLLSGIPVLTSDCSSLPEAGQGLAVLADPNNAEAIAAGWQKCLAENRQLKETIEREAARLSIFSPESHVQRMRDVYLHCLSEMQ